MIEPDTQERIAEMPGRIVTTITTGYYAGHQQALGRYYEPNHIAILTLFYLGIIVGALYLNVPLVVASLVCISGLLWMEISEERKWSDTSDSPAVEIEQEPDTNEEGYAQ